MKPILVAVLAVCGALSSQTALAQSKKAAKNTAVQAPMPGTVTVSDFEFNTFSFPAPIKRVYFPAGSPVVGKPMYLGDNSQVMLQFEKGHKQPIQMVVELEDGRVESVRVLPRPVPGVTHGASVRAKAMKKASEQPQASAPRGEDIELLKQVVTTHEAPAGFDSVALPRPTRFDKFTVVPLAGWSDGGSKKIMIFSLVAVPGQTAVVAPPQFYRNGITAVMLDGDVVDEKNSPQLFVVEELNDE